MGMMKLAVIGNLGRGPEQRETSAGRVVSFSVAANSKSKDGDRTDWIRCSAWGKTGDVALQYLKKGAPVYVDGTLRIGEYNGKPSYDLKVDTLTLVGGRRDSNNAAVEAVKDTLGGDETPF